MIKTVLLLLFSGFLLGCDGAGETAHRVCNVINEAHLDISPEPNELHIEVKQCDDKNYELELAVESKVDGSGRVLIKQNLGSLITVPTISALDIRLSKTEFREYTLYIPPYVDIDKYMTLRTINSKQCLELKNIDLCFEQ